MAKFRKKPAVIEARQLTSSADWNEIGKWCAGDIKSATDYHVPGVLPPMYILIHTLEGTMRANVDDWIIQGVKGEFYPCKPDIFAATYEPATPQTKTMCSADVENTSVQFICRHGSFPNPCKDCQGTFTLCAEPATPKESRE